MWKWLIGVIAVVVLGLVGLGAYLSDKIHLRPAHQAVAAGDFERLYQPEALKADFRTLIATAAHIHPDIGAVVDPVAYPARQAEIIARLDHPMTRMEFARIASAIEGQWRDGHTSLRRPQEEWEAFKARGKVVPLLVSLDDQGMTVRWSLGEDVLPVGARVVSINGVDAQVLRDWMLERTSGETLAYRRAYDGERFAAMAWLYGLAAPYRIVWRAAGAAQTSETTSPGVRFAEWDQVNGALGSAPVTLKMDGDVAHLVVSSLEAPDAQFKASLKTAFRQIQDRRARALVLDLRQNGGGDSRQGDELQTYLSDDKLPGLSEVSVRTTPEVKALYRTLLPEGFRWIPLNSLIPMLKGIQDGPDDGFYVFHPDGKAPKPRLLKNSLAFKGPVYVLISPVTYSSAAIFAAPLKYWKRATFIGQPTGEPMTFFGDNYEFDLPGTHLVGSVSHKRFVLLGSKGPGEGLQPDIPTTDAAPDAYVLALRRIAAARR